MRRADRLFQIVQYLRARRLTTAGWLAEKLETSTRTIYRDVADLIASGVPIEGEAGVGYVIRRKLDLPPLMFDRRELTALELGLRFVHAYTEPPLTLAATTALAKIRSVLPGTTGADLTKSQVYVPRREQVREPRLNEMLEAVHDRRKLALAYRDAQGAETDRTVWPLGVFFWGNAWTVLAWCELRNDFRSFRLERISAVKRLDGTFEDVPGRRLMDYFRSMQATYGVPLSDFDPEQ